jgi:hypothetical protein
MKLITALPLAICLLPAVAHADWQYTKWGMSPSQVAKASKGASIAATDDEAKDNSSRDGSNIVKLTASYTAREFTFKAFFGFDKNDKLQSVSLHLVGGDPHSLIGTLHDKYGKPDREPRPDLMRLWSWKTSKDSVEALMIGENVTVNYGPAHSTTEKGL